MKKLLLANFKSNKSISEANVWMDTFLKKIAGTNLDLVEIAVAPSFLSLEEYSVKIADRNAPVSLTMQNISAYPAGSYTGAVSVQNVQGLQIKYAIVGHSERRRYFGETSDHVVKKIEQAIAGEMTPIVCFDTDYLEEQIKKIPTEYLEKCIFAYEPLAAIGSGNNASVDEVKAVRESVAKHSPDSLFLYGGSVTDKNVSEYLIVADGVLVGSFSLDATGYANLVATATGIVYQTQ